MQTAIEQAAWLSSLYQQAPQQQPQHQWQQQQQQQLQFLQTTAAMNSMAAGFHGSVYPTAASANLPTVAASPQPALVQAGMSMPLMQLQGEPVERQGSLVNLLQEILADEDTDGLLMDLTRVTGIHQQQQQKLQLTPAATAAVLNKTMQQETPLLQVQQQQQQSMQMQDGIQQGLAKGDDPTQPQQAPLQQQQQQRPQLLAQQMQSTTQPQPQQGQGQVPGQAAASAAAAAAADTIDAGAGAGAADLDLDLDLNYLETMLQGDVLGSSDLATLFGNLSRMCSLGEAPMLTSEFLQQGNPQQQQQQQQRYQQQQDQEALNISPDNPGSGNANNAGVGDVYFNGTAAAAGGDGNNGAAAMSLEEAARAAGVYQAAAAAASMPPPSALARSRFTGSQFDAAAAAAAGGVAAAHDLDVKQRCGLRPLQIPTRPAAATGLDSAAAAAETVLDPAAAAAAADDRCYNQGSDQGLTTAAGVQQDYQASGLPTAGNAQQQQQQERGCYEAVAHIGMTDGRGSPSDSQDDKCSASGHPVDEKVNKQTAAAAAASSRHSRRLAQKQQQQEQAAARKAQEEQQQDYDMTGAAVDQRQRRSRRLSAAAAAASYGEMVPPEQQQQQWVNGTTMSGLGTLGMSGLALSHHSQQQRSSQDNGGIRSPMASEGFAGAQSVQNPGTRQQQQQQSAAAGSSGHQVHALPKEKVQMMLAKLQPAALQQLLELQQTQPVLARIVMKRVLQQLAQPEQQQQQGLQSQSHGRRMSQLDGGSSGMDCPPSSNVINSTAAAAATSQHMQLKQRSSSGRLGDANFPGSNAGSGQQQQQRRRPLVFYRHRTGQRALQCGNARMGALNSSMQAKASSDGRRSVDHAVQQQQQQQQQLAMLAASGMMNGVENIKGIFGFNGMDMATTAAEPAACDSEPPEAGTGACSTSSGVGGGYSDVDDDGASESGNKQHKKQSSSSSKHKKLIGKRLRQLTQNDLSGTVARAGGGSQHGGPEEPDVVRPSLEQQQRAAAAAADPTAAAMAAMGVGGLETSMGINAITASCSAAPRDAVDPGVITQQARALVRILTKLNPAQLLQTRNMLSSVLARSAPGLMNYMPAIERMVVQLISFKEEQAAETEREIQSATSKLTEPPPSVAATPLLNMVPDAASPFMLPPFGKYEHSGGPAAAAGGGGGGAAAAGAANGWGRLQQQQSDWGDSQVQMQMQMLQYQWQQQQQQQELDPDQSPYSVATRRQCGRRTKRRSLEFHMGQPPQSMLQSAASAPLDYSSSSLQQQQQQQAMQVEMYPMMQQQPTGGLTREQQQQLALHMIQQQQLLQRQQQQLESLQQQLLGSAGTLEAGMPMVPSAAAAAAVGGARQAAGGFAAGGAAAAEGPPPGPGTADSVMLDPVAAQRQQEDALLQWLQGDEE